MAGGAMTLLFQQRPSQIVESFGTEDLLLVLLGAGLAFLGATVLRLGAQAWRHRRPIVIPTGIAMPVVGLLLLIEFVRFGRRASRGTREWGSGGDWAVLCVSIVVIGVFVVVRMRATARKLYVGGLALERGRQLARAALQAVAPDAKLLADEGDESIVRIAKEGPGLHVTAARLLGVVTFKPEGDLPAATRAELFGGIARCLDAEELTLRTGLLVRVIAAGLFFLAAGVALSVMVALFQS